MFYNEVDLQPPSEDNFTGVLKSSLVESSSQNNSTNANNLCIENEQPKKSKYISKALLTTI